MAHQNPVVSRYLKQLDGGLDLANIHAEECREILREIESHLAEAERSGVPLSETLQGLGSAEDLARAYSLELTLNPRMPSGVSSLGRVVAALRRGSALLASALLILVLAVLSLGLLVGGAVAVVGGIVAPFLPPTVLDPTLRFGFPQLVVVILGVVFLDIGIPCFRLMVVHLRILLKTLLKRKTGAV